MIWYCWEKDGNEYYSRARPSTNVEIFEYEYDCEDGEALAQRFDYDDCACSGNPSGINVNVVVEGQPMAEYL